MQIFALIVIQHINSLLYSKEKAGDGGMKIAKNGRIFKKSCKI